MEKLSEGYVSKFDVEDTLKAAAELNPERNSWYKGGLKKRQKVSLPDLQKAWALDGYPEDSKKIAAILKSFGYSSGEIRKVYSTVFDTKYGRYDTENSPAVTKMASFIMKYDYTAEVLHYLEGQYGFGGDDDNEENDKAVTEQVREIFERILREERNGLPQLQKEFEKQSLGRHRK